MEVALSSAYFLDRTSDTLLVQLPSWGDPILPQIWQHSEEEIRESFIWPREDDSTEKENDCVPMVMSDPLMDKEMLGLMQGTFDSEEQDHLEYHDGDDSYLLCRDDESLQVRDHDEESRCSLEDESSRSESSRLDSYDFSSSLSSTSQSDNMDYDAEDESRDPPATESTSTTFEWSLEAYYMERVMCFKLRALGGAYMQLMADEVIESLQAILEDSMDSILFRVQRIDGQVLLIDSTMIIPVVSSILPIHPHVSTPLAEEREEPESSEHDKKASHDVTQNALPVSIPSRKKLINKCIPERKQQNHIGFAWRAMYGRGKSRPRPPTPVE